MVMSRSPKTSPGSRSSGSRDHGPALVAPADELEDKVRALAVVGELPDSIDDQGPGDKSFSFPPAGSSSAGTPEARSYTPVRFGPRPLFNASRWPPLCVKPRPCLPLVISFPLRRHLGMVQGQGRAELMAVTVAVCLFVV